MAERIEWVSTKTAAQKLGISPKHLLRLREDKTFQKNKHWRDISRFNSAPSHLSLAFTPL